jgi:hypothetical protein
MTQRPPSVRRLRCHLFRQGDQLGPCLVRRPSRLCPAGDVAIWGTEAPSSRRLSFDWDMPRRDHLVLESSSLIFWTTLRRRKKESKAGSLARHRPEGMCSTLAGVALRRTMKVSGRGPVYRWYCQAESEP